MYLSKVIATYTTKTFNLCNINYLYVWHPMMLPCNTWGLTRVTTSVPSSNVLNRSCFTSAPNVTFNFMVVRLSSDVAGSWICYLKNKGEKHFMHLSPTAMQSTSHQNQPNRCDYVTGNCISARTPNRDVLICSTNFMSTTANKFHLLCMLRQCID